MMQMMPQMETLFRLYDDGEPVETKIASYEIDKSGESWVLNITDEEGDMFSLTKID